MAFDLEQRKQQAELFKLKSKQMQLETDMTERQLKAQSDLQSLLFKAPQQQQVTVQGPGAPQLPEDQAALLGGYSPGELEKAGGPQAILKQYSTEGPQPTGMANIPGTGGPWAGLSPEMQGIAQSILINTGDMGKTMATLQGLNVFPKQKITQVMKEGETLNEYDPNTDKSRTLMSGPPKFHPLTSVAPDHVALDPITRQPVFTAPSAPPKPREQGLMNVAPNGTIFDPVTQQPVFTAPPAPGEAGIKPISDENRIALADYHKPFIELDSAQQRAVNAQIKQDRVDVSAATGAESAKTSLAKQQLELLSPSEANELGVPYGTTREGAKGIPVITPVQRATLTNYQSARAIVNDIKQYSERVNTAEPGFLGRLEQIGTLWGSYTQSNPDGAMLLAKAGELGLLVKSLGQSGSLSDGDMARAAALTPGPTDTVQVAVLKLKDLENIINKGEAAFRASLGPGAKQALQAEQQPAPAVKSMPKEKPQAKQPAQTTDDDLVQQLGPMGREDYEATPDAEKKDFLRRYFKAREGKQGAPKR
jgi:hypothetical protein